MRTLDMLTQGSELWHAHRANSRNASDASAMMGCSPYKTRTQLLKERATGITPEVDAHTQARFDRGHEIEALARPIAEGMIGEPLSPVIATTDDGYLSASFDGISFGGELVWECKSWNEKKAADVRNGIVPAADYWQCVQQLVISGANELLYMVTDGTPENTVSTRMTLDKAYAEVLLAGWRKFDADLSAWTPDDEPAAPVVAAPIEALPAVVVQVQGALTIAGNLPAFGEALRCFVERIPGKPATDQEFADCEAACKALKKAEDALAHAEDSALAQISDVEVMRRTVADLKNLARATRLATEKLVTAEKEARKLALVQETQAAMIEHILEINRELSSHGAGHLPAPGTGSFAPCIKGLKSLDSMADKLRAELLTRKADADATAQCLRENRASLRREGGDWIALFADFVQVGTKSPEDFAALAELRIGKHKQAEAARLEAEHARIEAEAKAKAEREAAAKLEEDRRRLESEQRAAAEAERSRIRTEEQAKAQAEATERAKAEQAAPMQSPQERATRILAAQLPEKPAKDAPMLTLSQINDFLAPISITSAGLAELGFQPVATVKAARLYNDADFQLICAAIARHVSEIAAIVHHADSVKSMSSGGGK